MFDFS
jgi:hypothetical protein